MQMKVLTTEDFIRKSIEVHGNKYIYDRAVYKNQRSEVEIGCPEHGYFWQRAQHHMNGSGCPECANKKRGNALRKTKEWFIGEAIKAHGDKYEYDDVDYESCMKYVNIRCKKHGIFRQLPSVHLMGQGCPKCAGRGLTVEELVEEFKEAHPNEDYDYSKVEFSKMHNEVCIICHKRDKNGNEHGEFWQTPAKHKIGNGCPKCANEHRNDWKRITVDKFKEVCAENFNGKYDYRYVTEIKDIHDKVKVVCPKHGIFETIVWDHYYGKHGCRECGLDVIRDTNEDFIRKAIVVHGNKWLYDRVNYTWSREPVEIGCKEHGYFWQTPESHLKGCGCPKCAKKISKKETEICDYVRELMGDDNVEMRNRILLNGYEIDIYVPSCRVGIEYNGVAWHSERVGKGKDYHLNKLNMATTNGIRLIQIFEDEYLKRKDAVLAFLMHVLGKDKELYYNGEYRVSEVKKKAAMGFVNDNCVFGYADSTVHYGAYGENGELLSLISFFNEKEGVWRISNICTNNGLPCYDAFESIFNTFVSKCRRLKTVKVFFDRRYYVDGDLELFRNLGFKLNGYRIPDFTYVLRSESDRVSKYSFSKNRLMKEYGYPNYMTVSDMLKEQEIYRIWDCGAIRYEWNK